MHASSWARRRFCSTCTYYSYVHAEPNLFHRSSRRHALLLPVPLQISTTCRGTHSSQIYQLEQQQVYRPRLDSTLAEQRLGIPRKDSSSYVHVVQRSSRRSRNSQQDHRLKSKIRLYIFSIESSRSRSSLVGFPSLQHRILFYNSIAYSVVCNLYSTPLQCRLQSNR